MVEFKNDNKPETAHEREVVRVQSALCKLAANLLLVMAGEGIPDALLSQIASVLGHENLDRPWVDEHTIASTLGSNLEWNKGEHGNPYGDPHGQRVLAAQAAIRESLKLTAAQVLGNKRKETNARVRFSLALDQFVENSAALDAVRK